MSSPTLHPYNRSHLTHLEGVFHSNVGVWFAENELPDFHHFLDSLDEPAESSNYLRFADTVFDGDQIIGFGGIVARGELSELSWGMIHSSYHKQGLGRLLLEHRVRRTKDECPSVKSILSQTSPAASGFFQKHGFVECLRQPLYWGGETELVGMELSFDTVSRYQHPDAW